MESDFSVVKMQETLKIYLTTFFTHLSYMSDKAIADRAQDKFLEQQRKMKGG